MLFATLLLVKVFCVGWKFFYRRKVIMPPRHFCTKNMAPAQNMPSLLQIKAFGFMAQKKKKTEVAIILKN